MGSDRHYPEEAPAHLIDVEGFWIDTHAVTNEEFARFVADTGYATMCERRPGAAHYPGSLPSPRTPSSAVFRKPRRVVSPEDWPSWWTHTAGASWYHPEGPGSNLRGREKHPVVHVAYADALAYARWADKDLPTEDEWERAARGELVNAEFCWGDELSPKGCLMANFWQGAFPWQNLVLDGFEGTSPVGSFPANDFGLYDMAGNVWEWTRTAYRARHTLPPPGLCCSPSFARGADLDDPTRPFARRVLKGGSVLCAANYSFRYRPAARVPESIDTSACHIGFRCVVRSGPR